MCWQGGRATEPVLDSLRRSGVIAFDSLFPNWSAELMSLVERTLPPPVDLDAPAVQGKDLHGRVPDLLNRLVPPNARPGLN